MLYSEFSFFFFFNDTATTEIYTLSLHDALPIQRDGLHHQLPRRWRRDEQAGALDRKSTRLNSSHITSSYAVFCLKKKKKTHSKSTHKQITKTKDTHKQQNIKK